MPLACGAAFSAIEPIYIEAILNPQEGLFSENQIPFASFFDPRLEMPP
jgi:hypothetical protein